MKKDLPHSITVTVCEEYTVAESIKVRGESGDNGDKWTMEKEGLNHIL